MVRIAISESLKVFERLIVCVDGTSVASAITAAPEDSARSATESVAIQNITFSAVASPCTALCASMGWPTMSPMAKI
jgi:hypothetical protein